MLFFRFVNKGFRGQGGVSIENGEWGMGNREWGIGNGE